MKANELMIGDWVQYPATMGNLVPCKVVGISTEITVEFTTGARKYEALKVAQPIPLTSEILEKNGFERTNDYHFFDGDEYYEMELREISDSIWFVEYTDLEFSMPSQRMTVCNVHELQHALRLCGIEKNIEL